MTRKVSRLVAALAFAAAMLVAAVPAAADTRTAAASGTAAFRETAPGSDELAFPEIRRRVGARGTPVGLLPLAGTRGQFPPKPLANPVVASQGLAGTNPELELSVNGLTSRDQRLANGGNQFSVEPPDQALCVGNGFALESVNTVIRVKDTAGANLTGVVDLNSFYGYPAQFNRGPDPSGRSSPIRCASTCRRSIGGCISC